MLLTPGPIDKDFSDGDLTNWHLDIINNSENISDVYLGVYALSGINSKAVPIGLTSVRLTPGEYAFLTIDVDSNYEHTMPIVEIPNDEILITLYGRNALRKQISGAIYTIKDLLKIDRLITKDV